MAAEVAARAERGRAREGQQLSGGSRAAPAQRERSAEQPERGDGRDGMHPADPAHGGGGGPRGPRRAAGSAASESAQSVMPVSAVGPAARSPMPISRSAASRAERPPSQSSS